MMTCAQCGAPIERDEAGLSRKLINRATTKLYCFTCLEAMFRIPREKLDEMIEAYRPTGAAPALGHFR